MKYEYKAKQRSGSAADGVIEAASVEEARQRLRSQGLFVLSLRAIETVATGSAKPRRSLRSKASGTDILMLISQLTIMSQSGVDLAECLKNLAQQCTKPALKPVLEAVHRDVSNGFAFSEALRRHPDVFNQTFVAGIAAGEKSGTMTAVLERLTSLIRGEIRLRSTVWSMLMYPIVLCGVTFLVVNAMVFFVLPQFAKVFEDLGKPAPPLTQVLLSGGAFARENLFMIGAGLVGAAVATAVLRKTAAAQRLWDYLTLHLALVKNATRSLSTGRTFRLLGTMLQSGVPLVEGIRLCRDAARNGLFRQLFDSLERDVLDGQGLSKALAGARFLPMGAAHMVATAERTGKLGQVLQSVGEYYEDEGERHLRDLIKIVEPAMILGLGAIVAVVVLSVVLPLLDVSTMSH